MTAEAFGGPVSAVLESDVRTWVRRQGILVWLDREGRYSNFVERLTAARATGEVTYDVRTFRGSHLELMFSLDGIAAGVDKAHLVLHLSGFNEDSVKQTPLLELYEAGTNYRKALETLITEAAGARVRPNEIAAFLARPGLTLESADAWLADQLRQGSGGFASLVRALTPTALLDDLVTGGEVASRVAEAEVANDVWERLVVWTGLPDAWRNATSQSSGHRAEDVAFTAASWALSVEYALDLKRAPIAPLLATAQALPGPVISTCRAIAAHLRERHRDFYRRTADETEALLAEEVDLVEVANFGSVETFRFEEDRVLRAALTSLQGADWNPAEAWARTRVQAPPERTSFWLRDDPVRQSTWQLVSDAARLGQAIAKASERLALAGGLEAALDAYVERGAAVDQAHRHLEQNRTKLLYPSLPDFEVLRARLDDMRRTWRRWADAWAHDFNSLCRAHGFLPPSSHQQRALFNDVVRPMTQESGVTAFFLVDAFRFEMADELYRELVDTPATTVQLKPRLAELPTVTAVGMNVLAPVTTNGRLRPVLTPNAGGIDGFASGEFRVRDPETRRRAMHDRVGGAACPWLTLDEVVNRDAALLKRSLAQAKLAIVHSQEIDNAGEKGVGPAVFDLVLQKLRAAWRLLRDAGVRRFVFTSDHGFLLLDETTALAQAHGRRIDPSRRHVLSSVAADHAGEVRVSLADLGYEGVDAQLMFPDTTAVFDTARRNLSFVHGGNSLQERVIPVLTVVHRAAAGANTLQYVITSRLCEGVAGMHCLEVQIEVETQRALDFGSPREIELALRVLEVQDVQVELCQTRGKARIVGGALQATVGERFEVFFRLAGPVEVRVQVELHHPGARADVRPSVPDARFAVTASGSRSSPPSPSRRAIGESGPAPAWLMDLPEGGIRSVFAHLASHGTITETEAASMLGGARGLRRFALQFDGLVQKVPFGVRIDVIAGVKHYVREGTDG